MNILKLPKHKSAISEAAYIALNVGLAVVLLVVVLAVNSPWPAFLLILLSKWRILAVRPRFWFKNIQSNLVDIIVGLSVVVLLQAASGSLALQIGITAFYAIWLLFIKPRSKRNYVVFQAGTALFLGVVWRFSRLCYTIPMVTTFVFSYGQLYYLSCGYDKQLADSFNCIIL